MKQMGSYGFLAALSLFPTAQLVFTQRTAGGLLPATHHGMTEFAEEDIIDAGVGSVHLISADDQHVAQDLVNVLEANGRTTVVGDIALGELLCDSLEYAPASSLLRFATSIDESVIAERTSFSFIDGSVFPDGHTRETWLGDVVDPEPAVASMPRTVSMTWTNPCNPETLLLELVSRSSDGTTSVVKTIPCATGSRNETCIVELEVVFNDYSEHESLLGHSTAIAVEDPNNSSKGQESRMLKQIDVMVLYTPAAASVQTQLTAQITAAMVSLNTAVSNSGIANLNFRLTHMQQIPYEDASNLLQEALQELKADEDVKELRNEKAADLVQLVGAFDPDSGFCGIGDWFNGHDGEGFSAVDPRCFTQYTNSHEIGHNLGCLHDRNNTPAEFLTDEGYAHGYRVCDGTAPFITIMAYQQNGCENVGYINQFSTPSKSYQGQPTGDAENKCAQTIKDHMVAVSLFRCADDTECTLPEMCCPDKHVCEVPISTNPTVCGDPHMTGFHGQKFDFTGNDGQWYCLFSNLPSFHLNMRVTAPVSSRTDITYITGLSLITTDGDGLEHTVVVSVKDPHNLDSYCPVEVSPCLADGSLSVVLDGKEALLAPGAVALTPDIKVSAVNLPGACRSFGFEKYWERKKLEYAQAGRRSLRVQQGMGEWILGDPTATNMKECQEYVTRQVGWGGDDELFTHQSEHASFQIVTPAATVRLSHGRIHQIAQLGLPDHLTWQMNLAVDHHEMGVTAKGILGETIIPTRTASGEYIMDGMEAIRGTQEDYHVAGPLGVDFVLS